MSNEEFNNLFKEGDIITSRHWIFIFDRTRPAVMGPLDRHAIVYKALMNLDDEWLTIDTRTGIGYVDDRTIEDTRLSSNEELDHLFRIMEWADAYWDNKNKVIRHISNNGLYTKKYDSLIPYGV